MTAPLGTLFARASRLWRLHESFWTVGRALGINEAQRAQLPELITRIRVTDAAAADLLFPPRPLSPTPQEVYAWVQLYADPSDVLDNHRLWQALLHGDLAHMPQVRVSPIAASSAAHCDAVRRLVERMGRGRGRRNARVLLDPLMPALRLVPVGAGAASAGHEQREDPDDEAYEAAVSDGMADAALAEQEDREAAIERELEAGLSLFGGGSPIAAQTPASAP